jgi:hypothetical protein
MSETDNNLNDALHIAPYIVFPLLGHSFNYWAVDLICFIISFLLINFFWRDYVEFSNHKPSRLRWVLKKRIIFCQYIV